MPGILIVKIVDSEKLPRGSSKNGTRQRLNPCKIGAWTR